MSYIISAVENTYPILDYLYEKSMDFSLFMKGISLKGLKDDLIYKAKSKSSYNKIWQ